MQIIKTKINYEDERGIIRDLFTHRDVNASTFITFKKGTVRGNHYHNKTMQYDYILKGSLLCRSKEGKEGKVEEATVSEGDLIIHTFPSRHAYKALEDSEMISSTNGPRQGEEYETDTIRLTDKEKLF